MIFWIREIAGWILVVAALVVMRTGLNFAMSSDSPRIVEASVIIFGALGLLGAAGDGEGGRAEEGEGGGDVLDVHGCSPVCAWWL